MSFASEELSDRVRRILSAELPVREQKMFGGRCFMLNGNMLVCPTKSGNLLVRTGPDRLSEALERPGAVQMTMQGRTMNGFVEVSADAIEDDEILAQWVALAQAFVATLPPKQT